MLNSYEDKSLAAILDKVASEKNCNKEELIYNVIEEKNGLFGLGSKVIATVYCLDDVTAFIKNYLNDFFTGLNLSVDINVTRQDESYKVVLNADNNAMLIGKNGSSLQAMNIVLRGAVNSCFKRRFYCFIDINNYKVDKYEKVKAMAKRIAVTVSKTHVDAALDSLTNDERKVVHQYLADFKNIQTVSEGEGRNRRLKIVYDKNKE
ncbi:MAG: R3H domain-containing nucleic acid-binding protein [Erysipelotrichaceae bacterium]